MKVLHVNSSFYTWLGIANIFPGDHIYCNGNYDDAIKFLEVNRFDLIIIEQEKGMLWWKLRVIANKVCEAKIILLSKCDNSLFNMLMRHVCNGFFSVDMKSDINVFVKSMRSIHKKLKGAALCDSYLSEREFEILQYLSLECGAYFISTRLALCYKTIQAHKYNIIKKSKSSSTREFYEELACI